MSKLSRAARYSDTGWRSPFFTECLCYPRYWGLSVLYLATLCCPLGVCKFYSIHRPTLYSYLKSVLQQAAIHNPAKSSLYLSLQSFCHKLLAHPVTELRVGEHRGIPQRKCLRYAAPACGLPIGNLSSQFFANVYLNELDQYVKHSLKVTHYLRYVDDFVLFSPDREKLQQWHNQIYNFLQQKLRLQLKSAQIQPIKNGLDFLGYRIYPHYRTVRPRVIAHCLEHLTSWQESHVRCILVAAKANWQIVAKIDKLQSLRAILASYLAHFSHAQSYHLLNNILRQFPWLKYIFISNDFIQGKLTPRWQLDQGYGLHSTIYQLRQQYPSAWIVAACGLRFWLSVPGKNFWLKKVLPALWQSKRARMLAKSESFIELAEYGWLRHGGRERLIYTWSVQENHE